MSWQEVDFCQVNPATEHLSMAEILTSSRMITRFRSAVKMIDCALFKSETFWRDFAVSLVVRANIDRYNFPTSCRKFVNIHIAVRYG